MRIRLTILLMVLMTALVSAQDFSERQEIAIFRLSYFGQPEVEVRRDIEFRVVGRGPLTIVLRGTGVERYDQLFDRAFAAIESDIQEVFVSLGRFTVIGMQQRLTQESVSDFIDVLSEFQLNDQLPEPVLLGQQPFTEADFRRIAGDFIVIVPSVTWYDLNRTDSGDFIATIETSFSFLDVATGRTFDQFSINTSGTSEDASGAVRQAVEEIPAELSFRVRSMERFRIRTGVLEVNGSEVLVEFGRDMGLVPGEEYAIIQDRVLANGRIVSGETGLLLIRDVQSDFSYAQILYAVPSVQPGDQLREVPRRGIETELYLDVMTDGVSNVTYIAGLQGTVSRGFYDFRPFAAFEIPFRGLVGNALLPMNLRLGGEWNLFLGRLRLTPSGSIGVGGAVPLSDDPVYDPFYLSHLGVSARISGSLMVTRDILVEVKTGLGWWQSLVSTSAANPGNALSTYGGLIIGGGVTFK